LRSAGTTSLYPLDIYRCLRLKLWDPERNRLVTFREFRAGKSRPSVSGWVGS
jgi:omega-6 fatty acid desaturase (delta-12 desaturase)